MALDGRADAFNSSCEVLHRTHVQSTGGAGKGFIHASRELLKLPLDRDERCGRRRSFYLRACVGQRLHHPLGFELRRRIGRQPFDTVGQLADLPFQPFHRDASACRGGQQATYVFALSADLRYRLRVERYRSQFMHLVGDIAQLKFQAFYGRLRIMIAPCVDHFPPRLGNRSQDAVVCASATSGV